MGFFSFIVLLAIAYLVWRVTDQLPDLIFRLSEIQRDVAEVRRRMAELENTGRPADSGRTAAAASQPLAPAAASQPLAPGAGAATSGNATAPATPGQPGGAHRSGPIGDETGADYSGS